LPAGPDSGVVVSLPFVAWASCGEIELNEGKSPFTSLIYHRSLILVAHPQNWVSEAPQLSNLFIFGPFGCFEGDFRMICALFVWLISHQPIVFFSQNKSATSNQPTVLFFQNKSAPAVSQTNRLLTATRYMRSLNYQIYLF
jgi:hypothetical protein